MRGRWLLDCQATDLRAMKVVPILLCFSPFFLKRIGAIRKPLVWLCFITGARANSVEPMLHKTKNSMISLIVLTCPEGVIT